MNFVDLSTEHNLICVGAAQRVMEVVAGLIEITAALRRTEDLVPGADVPVDAAHVRAIVLDSGCESGVIVLAVRGGRRTVVIWQGNQLEICQRDGTQCQPGVGWAVARRVGGSGRSQAIVGDGGS